MNRIGVIGSGLAAVSATKALIKRGIKPIIIDSGENMDRNKRAVVSQMSRLNPSEWDKFDLNIIASNCTIKNNKGLPLKLSFGSDYFYGKSIRNAPAESDDILAPFSYAKGGFSVGWGASVLPADDNDLNSWPINRSDLSRYYIQVLNDIPYSACDDGLSKAFPLYSDTYDPLKLNSGNRSLLKDCQQSILCKNSNDLLFGQSRLLVQATDNKGKNGCLYCGYCMSGCVYDCIYKSSCELDDLIESDLVDYMPGFIVDTVDEVGGKVRVSATKCNGNATVFVFDRVFIGAGAVNSTRIIMQSKNIYNTSVRLLSTVGFVAPLFRSKKSKIDWPNTNTQPGIFVEYKVSELSNHWVHCQLSTPNEIVLEMLGITEGKNRFFQCIRKKLSEHLIVAHCNIHSDHSNGYFLTLVKGAAGEKDILRTRRERIKEPYDAVKKATWKLFSIAKHFNGYVLIPFVRNSIVSGGFHVGGTMAMRMDPEEELETNILGNPKGWSRIHVIDSSIFPSIPATTIGLLAMANAARIVAEVELD